VLRLVLIDRESVASVELLADTLRLALTDQESVASTDELPDTLRDIEVDPVSDGVKLGDTGDFVREGVGVGVGMITV
jgi:hypothetical protein